MGIWGLTMTLLWASAPPHSRDTRAIGWRMSCTNAWVTLHTYPGRYCAGDTSLAANMVRMAHVSLSAMTGVPFTLT